MKKRRRKRKLSIKKISRLLIPIIIITLLIINKNEIYKKYLSLTIEYNTEAINTFVEDDIYNSIKDKKYSKTLEEIINTNYYDKTYLEEYLTINYINEENFLKNISLLLEIGYKSKEINNIYNTLNNSSIEYLSNNEYIKELTTIISLSYFKEDNLKRYIDFLNKTNKDEETIVTHVNIGLDNEYYTQINNIDNQDDILVLVNKYNALDKSYVPSDLETINSKYGSGKLRKEAKKAFEEMCEVAKKENIYIYSGSAYRSYDYQNNLYKRYVLLDGKDIADTYSARAGHSEHQTGLAIDILNHSWNYISEKDIEYSWLISNAHEFGFILRYPKEKENITGYMYEEWHFRYLGKDIATEIKEQNITYDEYIAKK